MHRDSDRSVLEPQFACYNAVLRRFPTELCERMGSFTTTIFVLISAVKKVARVMKLPEGLRLYRGMGGLVDLPLEFFHSDAQGVKGFVEWGFMSTTSNLEVGTELNMCLHSDKWCSRWDNSILVLITLGRWCPLERSALCVQMREPITTKSADCVACIHHRKMRLLL
jgi:hypothetical protein